MQNFLTSALEKLFVQADISAIPEYFSDEYTVHSEGKTFMGHKFIELWVNQIKTAFTDRKILNTTVLLAKDDKVVWERKLSAIHSKDKWGIKATNKEIVWREMVVSSIQDGKIESERFVSDLVGQLLKVKP